LKLAADASLLTIRRLAVAVLCGLLALPAFARTAHAAIPTAPTLADVIGEIERITINNPADSWSGGTIVVGGQNIILPRNLLMDLPANRLTLQQLFETAPAACVAKGETGLAKTDACNTSGAGGIATITANRTPAGVIAGDVFIQKGAETVPGVVTFMDFTDGYLRLNGNANDPSTGVMVRLNDPIGRYTVQQGLGCQPGSQNCSPDPRFTSDPDNYTEAYSTGYPVCLPSTVARVFTDVLNLSGTGTTTQLTAKSDAAGNGDLLCPETNRPGGPQPAAAPTAADSRRFAPILVGDHLSASGNFEAVNGVRFLSAWGLKVSTQLQTTAAPGQPDYMFIDEMFIDSPAFQRNRIRNLIIGHTTLPNVDVMMWTTHHDPATNAVHEFPLASVRGCEAAAGAGTCIGVLGPNTFRTEERVDFVTGPASRKTDACLQLRADPRFAPLNLCPQGGTVTEQFSILSPLTHEMQARTGRKVADPTLMSIDLAGNQAKNGQYLFPMGVGLGGIEVPFMLEINANALGFPTAFSGFPWLLDRRLSPGGCNGPCETTPQPLSPFPFEGFDPRAQATSLPRGPFSDPNFTASTLTSASNRILSFVTAVGGGFNFNGDRTVLAWPPATPAAAAVTRTPSLTALKPLVTGITPVAGAVGSTVLIDGTGLANARKVTFGGVPATSFRNVSPTQVSAVVPVGAQNGPVGVTTLVGATPVTAFSVDRFTVVSAPGIAVVTPSKAPVGAAVTITGSGFASTTNVAFNGTQAVFSVASDTSIRAVVPAGATTGRITVTNPGGTDTFPLPFTVQSTAPRLTSFGPANGPAGTVVTLTGTGLTGATNVAFNGVTATFSAGSDTSMTAKVPAGATSGTITVTTPSGSATSAASFTVTPPAPLTITSFTPASGPVGTVVTLTGTGLTGATSVSFNGITATQVSGGSDTSITAKVPPGATSGPITVTTSGASVTSSASFTVA
jgi:hypothetical protein